VGSIRAEEGVPALCVQSIPLGISSESEATDDLAGGLGLHGSEPLQGVAFVGGILNPVADAAVGAGEPHGVPDEIYAFEVGLPLGQLREDVPDIHLLGVAVAVGLDALQTDQ
jgi:hypothetical protein